MVKFYYIFFRFMEDEMSFMDKEDQPCTAKVEKNLKHGPEVPLEKYG